MKTTLQFISKNLAFITLAFFAGIMRVDSSFAQCATGTAPSYSSSCTDEYYTSITASGTGVTSTIGVSAGSCSGTYVNDYATQGVTVSPGATVNINISRYTTHYTAYLTVYVDWSNSGSFTPADIVGTMITLPSSTLSTVYSFVVPTTGIVTGTNLNMRVMLSETSSGAPCSASYGQTCDFYINVSCPSLPVISVLPTSGSFCAGGAGVPLTASGAGTGGTYTWSPASGLSATTGASVTAIPAGTTVYTVTGATSLGCGSTATATVTVNPSPAAITGASALCAGSSVALSDATAGGTWSSSNTAVATINPTGNVHSGSTGVTTIRYTLGTGCVSTATISVNTLPSAITGNTNVCLGSTTDLSNAVAGGAWSSDNTAIAVITPAGVVSGITIGTANITYTLGTCTSVITVTVNPLPGPITGITAACAGSTTILSDGSGSGVWSSSSTSIATVDAAGTVTGVTGGSATIIYTISGCAATTIVTIYSLPAPITGLASVCIGSMISLSDATSGGTWSISSGGVATVVTGTGVVTGLSAGSAIITYTSGAGCVITTPITVNALPGAITGSTTVCIGSATNLSDATLGGAWSSSNISVATVDPSGVVSGVVTGTTDITYTSGSTGCANTTVVTVSPLPVSITGSSTVCSGLTITLSDATPGGVWSSDNITVASVTGSGIVTGASGGTANISYSVGSCSVSAVVTVISIPAITGPSGLCSGSTIALSNAAPGGVWSSDNTPVATVSGGIVSGVSNGTADISYTVGGCSAVLSITVNSISPIIGPNSVCVGSTNELSDAAPGGVWSSSGTNVATVSPAGAVTGVVSGGTTIFYTIGACYASMPVTVGNAISPIGGTSTICEGATTSLYDPTPGGVWNSGSTSIAIVSAIGVVYGISPGTDNVSYTVGSCTVTDIVTVDANNAGTITGRDTVCTGASGTTALSDAVTGGVWSSSNTSHATVTAATGIVTGVISGIDTIKYTVTNTCGTFTAKLLIHILPIGHCPTEVGAVAGSQATGLKVFPNPNNGTFTMNLVSDIDEEVHVMVTNIVGEKVREYITTTNKATDIQLEPAAGIYLLSAFTTEGRYVTKVVVY